MDTLKTVQANAYYRQVTVFLLYFLEECLSPPEDLCTETRFNANSLL